MYGVLGNSVGMKRAGAVRPRLCCDSTTGASKYCVHETPSPLHVDLRQEQGGDEQQDAQRCNVPNE